MSRSLRAVALIFVSLFLFQCQKELSNVGGPDITPNIVTADPISATVQGNVLDETGAPAAGVAISVGSQAATTDASGYFRIKNASLDKNASLVVAEKTGYFKGMRSFSATSGTNQVVIKLIKKSLAGTINGTSGGEVTLTNGTKIALQANGVVLASSGSAYTGTVNVYASYIDPTAADISQTVPGSFMANDKNGSRVTLASYGMMAVELESAAGEKVQVKSGNTATLTTPIPASILASAPATISLWSVDEQTGLWKEEGTATKNGTNYVGDVKHFSFWNCDVNVPGIQLSMTVKNAAGQPLVHAMVRIIRATSGYYSQAYGWTDTLGQVAGLVPSNEALTLQVLGGACGNVAYTQNIGPFTQNTNLGVITVPNTSTSMVTVQGSLLNCSGTAVTSGYAIISYNNTVRYAAVNATGNFSVTFIQCGTASGSLQVYGVDGTTQQQGTVSTVAVTTPVTNVGSLTACGTSSGQFINYTYDGTSYSISSTIGDSLTSYTTPLQGTTMLQTFITGSHLNNSISFRFTSPSAVPGTYPAMSFSVNNSSMSTNATPTPSIVVTNFPTVIGDFYLGTFAGTFMDSLTTHTVNGSFKVRKNF
jgi:hypothetical protein